MKLLVQADDFGITKAVSLGILHGITNGIVKNTGLFTNMDCSKECVDLIRPYIDDIGFGIDLNLSTGFSVLDHNLIPTLTKENNQFYSSSESRMMDNEDNNFDHLNYDEVYLEFNAQIKKFIELVGKKPDYIHNHAYFTKTIFDVTKRLSYEYEIPCSIDLGEFNMGWYSHSKDLEKQYNENNLKEYLLEDKNEYLNKEIGLLVTHCGYMDADLLKLSSFTTCRIKDLEVITSLEIKEWIIKNNIELITYKQLKER